MSNKNTNAIHWSFWVIGAIALVWNAMGCINFIMQMNPDMLASMPESHREIAESRPPWATGAFALSVFSGALGGLLLLLKRRSAVYFFIASFIGTIVTMTHAIGFALPKINFGPFEMFIAFLMPLVVAAFLIWYSRWVVRNGWIN